MRCKRLARRPGLGRSRYVRRGPNGRKRTCGNERRLHVRESGATALSCRAFHGSPRASCDGCRIWPMSLCAAQSEVGGAVVPPFSNSERLFPAGHDIVEQGAGGADRAVSGAGCSRLDKARRHSPRRAARPRPQAPRKQGQFSLAGSGLMRQSRPGLWTNGVEGALRASASAADAGTPSHRLRCGSRAARGGAGGPPRRDGGG